MAMAGRRTLVLRCRRDAHPSAALIWHPCKGLETAVAASRDVILCMFIDAMVSFSPFKDENKEKKGCQTLITNRRQEVAFLEDTKMDIRGASRDRAKPPGCRKLDG